MSLYNSLFGVNKAAPILLKILGLSDGDFGRFRDCYLNEDGTKIIVYTRCGGGNREDYQDVFNKMQNHPEFVTDYDDDFDCTYASFEFNVPDDFKEDLKLIAPEVGQKKSPSEKFAALLSDMEQGIKNPAVDNAMQVGGKIMGEINKALDSGENKVIGI